MKKFKKFMAMSMSLAVLSTSTAVTSFAASTETAIPMVNAVTEGAEQPTTETRVIGSSEFTITTIDADNMVYEITIKDITSGLTSVYKDNSVIFYGKEIYTIREQSGQLSEDDIEFILGAAIILNMMEYEAVVFADDVEIISDLVIDGITTGGDLTIKFGRNIKEIPADLIDLPDTAITIEGYKGTAAEVFAAEQNYTFIALDETADIPAKSHEKGDINGDGVVDSSDASAVLAEYSTIQTGGASTLSDEQIKSADVNEDNVVDSSDASEILRYYADLSTGKTPTWNNN
ncbi:MAG: hypothetical protein IJN43_15880 [Ruminococcus sp.]|nr:hypothetical protein [Ruminococcus sp.]